MPVSPTNETTTIEELERKEQFDEAYPILNSLYRDLTYDEYVEHLDTMRQQGYRLFGLYVADDLVSLAGVNVVTNFSNGKHLYLYDLVTHPDHRSHGFGRHLMDYIHEWAREKNCNRIKLITSRDRTGAHNFYATKMNYRKTGYVFKYDL